MNKNDDRKAQLRVMGAVAVLAAGVGVGLTSLPAPAEAASPTPHVQPQVREDVRQHGA
ncbi:hypothetical protein [Barrientosiimonas humi]|uniref:hypothetical protein n=1 Tax=Barrientosiimonas humi TaxID=999931 RepID=UPI00370D2A85